jgi:hypothetical protein
LQAFDRREKQGVGSPDLKIWLINTDVILGLGLVPAVS